jgi:hypothetical protein
MLSTLTAYAETHNIGSIAFGSNLEESIPGETLLLLKNKENKVLIESIKKFSDRKNPEDFKTLSMTSEGVCVESAIKKVLIHRCSYPNLLKIIDVLNREVVVTPCHSILTFKDGKFIAIKSEDLKIGDWILTPKINTETKKYQNIQWDCPEFEWMQNFESPCQINGMSLIPIKKITKVKAPELVYDLSVPGNENFVLANGIVVHNSGSYPDNEQEFGRLFNKILPFSTQNGTKIILLDPLSHVMKHEVVKIGNEVGVPWKYTWSCYGDGERHCGTCGPDFMRKTAFQRNGLLDPVFQHEWDDPFWDGCKECQ